MQNFQQKPKKNDKQFRPLSVAAAIQFRWQTAFRWLTLVKFCSEQLLTMS